jgi:sugar lactone lactonase YvrE
MNKRIGTGDLRRIVFVLSIVSILVIASTLSVFAGPDDTFPKVIRLPNGLRPEGVAIGRGTSLFVGSLANGAIYRGDLRTGQGGLLYTGEEGRIAVGLAVDERTNYLFVAGGLTGKAFVYDAERGVEIAAFQLTAPFTGFVNDVIVTRDFAFFTDSFQAQFYRLPLGPGGMLSPTATVERIELKGDWMQVPGPFVFNANGIDATPNGKQLVMVNSTVGALYRVDPISGYASQIDLGEAEMTAGDGILLDGKTLFVMRNRLNQIAVIQLAPDMSSGTVVDAITDPDFRVPTTIAEFGDDLYAVNARFGTDPKPDTEYEVVQVSKH